MVRKKSVKKKEKKGKIFAILGLILSIISLVFSCLNYLTVYGCNPGLFFYPAFIMVIISMVITLKEKERIIGKIGVITSILSIILLIAFYIALTKNGSIDCFPNSCFEAVDQLEIDTASQYTCYYMEDGHAIVNLSVKRGPEKLDLEGFMITVFGEGESDTFEIKENTDDERVSMLSGSQEIEIPKVREMKTYSLKTTLSKVTSAEIYPVVEGRQCNAGGRNILYECPTEKCGIEQCHGLDITCGPNIPEACNDSHHTGDNCRKFVSCEIINRECKLVKDERFDACKSCVEKCEADYKTGIITDVYNFSKCEYGCS